MVAGDEHVGQGGGVAETAGDGERLVAQPQAVLIVAAEHQLLAEVGEEPGPNLAVVASYRFEGGLQGRHPLGVDHADRAEEVAPHVGQRGTGERQGVTPLLG